MRKTLSVLLWLSLWLWPGILPAQEPDQPTPAPSATTVPATTVPATTVPATTVPATTDAEILARLPAVRVVISDRQTPGQPHFLIDEESFRQAFGVGSPVQLLDVASVAIVAASQLRRETVRSQQQIILLENELDRLRFRSNMTLLLVIALVLSTLVRRRSSGNGGPELRSKDSDP